MTVAPGVIGTADGAFDLARLGYEDHAAMAADILEHAHLPVLAAHREERDTEKIERLGITRFGNFGFDANCRLQAAATLSGST